jgi:hypothetical protein
MKLFLLGSQEIRMLKIVTTYTRPSVDVPFFVAAEEFTTMYKDKYLSTGKVLEMSNELTNNGLSGVITATWRSRAEFAEFLEEPLLDGMKNARQLHMDTHGITSEQSIEFTPSYGDPGQEPHKFPTA